MLLAGILWQSLCHRLLPFLTQRGHKKGHSEATPSSVWSVDCARTQSMETSERHQTALRVTREQLAALQAISSTVTTLSDVSAGQERLARWKERTVRLLAEFVSQDEARRLERKQLGSYSLRRPGFNYSNEFKMYEGYMVGLIEALEKHPGDIVGRPSAEAQVSAVAMEIPTATRTVFLIHGKDELNLLKLERLLEKKWNLNVIIMRDKPGKGRTLVEKFEQEAQPATFAIALFSPDDFVQAADADYVQARPNVIFELGYFYGRLGRERVCILLEKGTKIHSDLEGINVIHFEESVEEKVADLEKELRAADLVE